MAEMPGSTPAGATSFARRHGPALAVLAICLTATFLVVWQLGRVSTSKDDERFDNAVERLNELIVRRIAVYEDMLRATAGMLDLEGPFDRRAFQRFVQRLEIDTRYPGIRGIGYSERITPAELPALLAQQRREIPGFRVWPEDPRDEYYAILYLEPLDERNRAALGYDMFTDATRRDAMERARDTGQAAASAPVRLVQEIGVDKQAGFLIYTPVYEGGGVPPTVEERRAKLRGFVYVPFRGGDLFSGILAAEEAPRAGFELRDGSSPQMTIFRAGDRGAGRFMSSRTIPVSGRTWEASFFSLPGLERASYAALVPGVLGTGVALSLLVALLVGLQSAAGERRAAAEQAAREHAELVELVNATGTQLAGELDLDRLVQALTDAGVRLTRAQFGAFFYNVVNAAGESYTLYALSGLPREAFGRFPMPRNTAVFGPTFSGEGIVRSDDITRDPRYGHSAPYHGMPDGHPPVRSYLAVPVVSRSGEVLGGLFFGHSEAGRFTAQHERVLRGVAAQASVAIDNARLYNRVQELLERERAARAEAERGSQLKDEFLATLSHELRTPLNAVLGWTHLVRHGGIAPDRFDQALETIHRNAQAQSQLIDDLLDMSRIVAGRLRIDLDDVDVASVLEAAIGVVRPAADAKGVRVTTTCDPVPPLRADAARLQQVFWNLLSNAVKFTPRGGQVDVALRWDGVHAEVTVRDTGIGINTEFLPAVFDRFRQADVSTGREHGGLGLGLSIVRSLVQMHGGTVEAHSDGPGTGATFTVRLPAGAAAAQAS